MGTPSRKTGACLRARAPRFIAIAQGSARAAGSLSHWLNLNEMVLSDENGLAVIRFRLTQDSEPWPPQ
jgi:cysteine sulfinate desulfinase/cysteine desulfurase-like protein